MTTAAELEPGQSVFDHDFPERARLVHSVRKVPAKQGLHRDDGTPVPTVQVRWGHPDQPEPEPFLDDDGNDTGIVPADKEYDVIAR
jgi:hypothetical protein